MTGSLWELALAAAVFVGGHFVLSSTPLRAAADVAAVIDALADGTIDLIATDHAPHAETDKVCTYNQAAHGINVLETALGQVMGLVHDRRLDLPTLIGRMTAAPAAVLGRELGSLRKGFSADIVILDPDSEWEVDPALFASKSVNTPLAGVVLKGRVVRTIYAGTVVYESSLTTAEPVVTR